MNQIKMKPIYGLIWGIPDQEKIIDAHCFKTCGKIIVGGITDKELGALMVCRTPKDQCPHLDKEMDEPFGEVNGEPVFIRKLK
jgi:hypothetical protein